MPVFVEKSKKRFLKEAAGALVFHQQLLDEVLQFWLILTGGIEKRTPGLGLYIKGVTKQLLSGLSLLTHLSHPVAIGNGLTRPADLRGNQQSRRGGGQGLGRGAT